MSEKIKYRKGYKYQLVDTVSFQLSILPKKNIKTEYIHLSKSGLLTIKKGYCWDGPSGPTYDSKNFMKGSLVHDALYELLRKGFLPQSERLNADQELSKLCKEDGMSSFRRWYIIRELRKFGASAADPKNKKKIIIAP